MARQPGQISPDGLWRWDGQMWVPTGSAPVAAPRRSSAWIWWLAGCAALIAVVTVIGLGFLGVEFFNAARSGAFNCVPSEFPKYPGASFSSVNVTTNGASRTCVETFVTADSQSTVVDFYKSRLSEAPWQVTDSGPSSVNFLNPDTGASGTVQVTPTDGGSEIEIDYKGP